ncbi:MAG: hypothetical protein U0869_25090, partial [Chloroflexota bacterium]
MTRVRVPGIGAIVMAGAMVGAAVGPVAAASSGGWSNLGTGGTATTPPIDGRVYTTVRVGDKLYVGGDFVNAGGVTGASRIAVWDPAARTWSALGAGIANGSVTSIIVDGSTVYASGSFDRVGPSGQTLAPSFAVWNGSAWGPVNGQDFNGPVWALARVGDKLMMGGGFDNAAHLPSADSIVAWDLQAHGWASITPNNQITGTVFALAADGSGGLWMGGTFVDAFGIQAGDRILHWDGVDTFSAVGVGVSGTVRALVATNDGVTAAGDFLNAGGTTGADLVAHWNGSAWSAIGTPKTFLTGDSIYGLTLDGGDVFVAGIFLNAGGDARMDAVAAYDGVKWRPVGSDAAGANGPGVAGRAVAVVGRTLFFGGLDGQIGGGKLNKGIASFRLRQPDVAVGVGAGAVAGANVYNTTASGQSRSATVARGGTATFRFVIANDGALSDTLRFRSTGSGGGFTATWRTAAGKDVTAAVVAGTYQASVAPGARVTLTLKVKAGAAAAGTRSWKLTATSQEGGAAADAAKAVVSVG